MVTDDARALRETLEAATCKRVSALEGVGATERVSAMEKQRGDGAEGKAERPGGNRARAADKGRISDGQQAPEPERDRFRGSRDAGMEMRCLWSDHSIVGTVVGFQSVLPDPLLLSARFGHLARESKQRIRSTPRKRGDAFQCHGKPQAHSFNPRP